MTLITDNPIKNLTYKEDHRCDFCGKTFQRLYNSNWFYNFEHFCDECNYEVVNEIYNLGYEWIPMTGYGYFKLDDMPSQTQIDIFKKYGCELIDDNTWLPHSAIRLHHDCFKDYFRHVTGQFVDFYGDTQISYIKTGGGYYNKAKWDKLNIEYMKECNAQKEKGD